ncbi:MAG: hypothetical protein EA402_08200 [Planctomycetota bacterium]|nr:MAG: hypothetical protein EA402_08200 [Planctomycetota bacterium]
MEAIDLTAAGDWDGAHQLVMPERSPAACWLHAILHRMEGDLANADYWYGLAGRRRPSVSTDEELEHLRRGA